ncbi:cathepsin K [Xenopus laevis]|uniref:Cathepsin K n=2 Tax=Xenopus laevis TaxID=8355 RepID=A0A974H998_XENLA|nr:cathepsin K [Xenopus laevis]OCT69046.1 hypothetical protein XELAEV_18040354mg [Xenopus laevis]
MLALSLLLLVLPLVMADVYYNGTLDSEWEIWKTTYHKQYNNKMHEFMRRVIWEKNFQTIRAHNLEYAQGLHAYKLAMNKFGDMASEELVTKMMGVKVHTGIGTTHIPWDKNEESHTIPDSIDYRQKGYVTSVKDQGACHSDWALSSVGALEGQLMKTTGKLVELSPQNLIDCVEDNDGCDGGKMTTAFEYVKINKGIDSEEAYPYAEQEQKCMYNVSSKAAEIKDFKEVQKGNEKALMEAVGSVGPVSVRISAVSFNFFFYDKGIYYEEDCDPDVLNLAVLIVGYGVDIEGKYWIVKNCWGEDWGEKGYILMAKDEGNHCGIANMASYPIM